MTINAIPNWADLRDFCCFLNCSQKNSRIIFIYLIGGAKTHKTLSYEPASIYHYRYNCMIDFILTEDKAI